MRSSIPALIVSLFLLAGALVALAQAPDTSARPDDAAVVRALIDRATALENDGDSSGAIARYGAALALEPTNTAARTALARLADAPGRGPVDLGGVRRQLVENTSRLDEVRRQTETLRRESETRTRELDQIKRTLDDQGRAESLPDRLDRDVDDLKRQVERLAASVDRTQRDVDRLRSEVDRLRARP